MHRLGGHVARSTVITTGALIFLLGVMSSLAWARGPAAHSWRIHEVDGTPIVATEGGVLRGQRSPSGLSYAFKGIPYAAPPIGHLRWQPPQRHSRWSGERDASAFGPACTQPVQDSSGNIVAVIGEEDCLSLNVFTPMQGGQGRPVMVWIHGGGNFQGNAVGAGLVVFSGDSWSEEHGVVFVSIQYRLGALGYLAHPALDATSRTGTSGNYGILDQMAALTWVRRNIKVFGGNPENIHVLGQSAGATDICALVTSPFSRRFIASATMASVIDGCIFPSISDYEDDVGATIVGNLQQEGLCGSITSDVELAQCLRALPAEAITRALPGNLDINPRIYTPIVDGFLLTRTPLAVMASGVPTPPLILGSTRDETRLRIPPVPTEQDFIALVQARYGALGEDAVAAILAAYPVSDFPSPFWAYIAVTTHETVTCPIRTIARAVAPSKRYRYSFERAFSPTLGAFHGGDVPYIFKSGAIVGQPDEEQVSDEWRGYLARFAATRNPNGDGSVFWPRYRSATDPYLAVDLPFATDTHLERARCDLWDTLLDTPRFTPRKWRSQEHLPRNDR